MRLDRPVDDWSRSGCDVRLWRDAAGRGDALGMSQKATAGDDVVVGRLAAAVAELRDTLETIAGKVDLDGEAVYVRANLDKASMLLTDVVGRRD